MDYFQNLPRWFLVLVAVIGVLAIGAIGTWAGAGLNAATNENHHQNRRLDTHEEKISRLDRSFERFEDKIDWIIERLGAK